MPSTLPSKFTPLALATDTYIGSVRIATQAELDANTKFDPITGARLVVPADLYSVIPPGAGITTLNGDNNSAQTLTVATTGSDISITDPGGGVHVVNIPTASASNRGALSSADWTTFNNKLGALTTLASNLIVYTRTAIANTDYDILTTDTIIAVTFIDHVLNFTLPTAIGNEGKLFFIKDESGLIDDITSSIHIQTVLGQMIDGVLTQDLSAYGGITIYSNGANWFISSRI